ncbi:hypothetical protein [Nocardiopsis tropica]|uniref:Uncharacterized protein n=1 Tax=Nocardiopsis tropica TaxID=109330 RepID=A0ABV2A4V4_9ACTN
MDLSIFNNYSGQMNEELRHAAMKAQSKGYGVEDTYDALSEVYRRWGNSPGKDIVWKQARILAG